MSTCDTCSKSDNCNAKENGMECNPLNEIKNVIGVMSGKGGVGKSTISTLLAKKLREKGFRVGVLDADVTGPSIPRLFNINNKKVNVSDGGIFPVETNEGIYVMSLNLLLEDENKPVIWRGPILSGTVKQFWTDVIWGDLDYMIIDLPPGTGDVPLTVMQSFPIDGLVMVSVPQDMVSMIVSKAVNMARKLNLEVLGLVENMSYIKCPSCGETIKMFESKNIDDFVKKQNLEILAELPMTKEIVNLNIPLTDEINKELNSMADKIIQKIA